MGKYGPVQQVEPKKHPLWMGWLRDSWDVHGGGQIGRKTEGGHSIVSE